ncbi:hypothetical protein GC167_10600 [bacterium]|nr:hypothetical protein [bacterium]
MNRLPLFRTGHPCRVWGRTACIALILIGLSCSTEPESPVEEGDFRIDHRVQIGAYPLGADSAYKVSLSLYNLGKAATFECITELKVGETLHYDTTTHHIDSAQSAGAEVVFASVPYHARIPAEVQVRITEIEPVRN